MRSAIERLVAFSISLISLSLAYKYADIQSWENYAFIREAFLFFVIGVIIREVFGIGLLATFAISALITAFIVAFISPIFSFIMILIFIILIVLIMIFLRIERGATW